MINFRFHLVSLIAVFLALGIGILVGSTVVDQVIVDRLDKEISSVRSESRDRGRENETLRAENARLDELLHDAAPFTVEGRLQGVPVAVFAERGVDRAVVKQMVVLLRAAGAEVPGILWLDDAWRLDTGDQLQVLRAAVPVQGNTAAARLAALRALARRVTTARETGAAGRRDVAERLRDAGFLELSDGRTADLDAFPTEPARVLVVTGTDSRLSDTETLRGLVAALTAADAAVVATEVYDDHGGAQPVPQRGGALAPVRGDAATAKIVSTVDDGELVQGQVGIVLALEQLADGAVGHYGYGPGVSAPLPEPLP